MLPVAIAKWHFLTWNAFMQLLLGSLSFLGPPGDYKTRFLHHTIKAAGTLVASQSTTPCFSPFTTICNTSDTTLSSCALALALYPSSPISSRFPLIPPHRDTFPPYPSPVFSYISLHFQLQADTRVDPRESSRHACKISHK